MLTDELATHLATRIEIHNGYALDSDHFLVVCDIPLNCVGAARNVTPVWSHQKVTKCKPAVSMHGGKFQAQTFNEALAQALAGDTEGMTGKAMYASVNKCTQEAAVGTTHEKHTLEYPSRVSKLKDFNTTDKQARTWKKPITGAIKTLKRAKMGTTTLDRVAKAMKKVGAASAVPLWEQTEGDSAAELD